MDAMTKRRLTSLDLEQLETVKRKIDELSKSDGYYNVWCHADVAEQLKSAVHPNVRICILPKGIEDGKIYAIKRGEPF